MSTLSKHNVARFNEDYKEAKETAAKSQVKSIFSQKSGNVQGPKSQISQATRSIWSRTRGLPAIQKEKEIADAEIALEANQETHQPENEEEAAEVLPEEQEQTEPEEVEVNADDKLTSVSQIKPA